MIKENLSEIRKGIPEGVKLACVSKFHPVEAIKEAYAVGERVFAESRPQEFVAKVEVLPKDIEWHFIGNLQTNKVKMVVPHATLIHSMANERLFDEVEKCTAKINKVQDVLIELHVAQEESKQGFTPEEAFELLSDEFIALHPHIRICGVMGMASLTDDETKIRAEFKRIKDTFERLRDEIFDGCDYFTEVSMGMSGDYPIAIEEGATIVRIGSSIFGVRNY